jgi:hypothetical protein
MKLIPSVEWIKNYDKKWLSGDISAGLTVGVMLIPQGMAYSMLAGLPSYLWSLCGHDTIDNIRITRNIKTTCGRSCSHGKFAYCKWSGTTFRSWF